MPSVTELLHDVSPYEGVDPESYAADLQGWGSKDPFSGK